VTDLACDTSDEGIAAIADPALRADVLRAIARNRGTLTPTQARLYWAAVAELRGDNERKHGWIARRLRISRSRVGQILAAARAAQMEVAS
jgi:hypothetical protein